MTNANPGVWPCLRFTDAEAGRRFLVEVLGFTESLIVRDGPRIAHAEMKWADGGGLMFGEGESPGGQSVYLSTDDVDAVYERAVAAGVSVPAPPSETDYGSRNVTVADSEGNSFTVGTYRGE